MKNPGLGQDGGEMSHGDYLSFLRSVTNRLSTIPRPAKLLQVAPTLSRGASPDEESFFILEQQGYNKVRSSFVW